MDSRPSQIFVRASPTAFILFGALIYAGLRTATPYAAWKVGALAALVSATAAVAWVLALLVSAVRRRHRAVWAAAGELVSAIGLGYLLAIVFTTPFRAVAASDMPLGSIWPLALGASVGVTLLLWPVAALLIMVGRRIWRGDTNTTADPSPAS